MLDLESAIKHCEEVAEKNDKIADTFEYPLKTKSDCKECAKEHRQLAKWLRELKCYKELNTYNRTNKCSECKYEDSAYYCDDCIWNFVNKFKQREVNADEDSD